MTETQNKEPCVHYWVSSPYVKATNPPIYDYICRYCGEEKSVQGYKVDNNEYFELKKKFNQGV